MPSLLFALFLAIFCSANGCFAAERISTDRWYCDPAWSPDGTKVAVLAYPNIVERGKPIPNFSHKSKFYILNAADNSVISSFEDFSTRFEWSPDGKILAVKTFGGGLLIDGMTGSFIRRPIAEPVMGRAWAKDSCRVVCSSFSQNADLQIVDVRSGAVVHCQAGPGQSTMLERPTLSPDDKYVSSIRVNADEFKGVYLSNRTPTYAHIWDTSSGKIVKTWKRDGHINLVDWTPDAKTILLSEPGQLRFFSAQSFEEVHSIDTKSRNGVPFIFTPDGTNVIYQDVDFIYIVRLSDLRTLRKIEGPTSGYLCMQCSPDGKTLLLNSGSTVALCNIATGKYICWCKMPFAGRFDWVKRPESIVGSCFHYAPYIVSVDCKDIKVGVNYFPSSGSFGAPNWFSGIHPRTVEETFSAFEKCLTAKQIEKFKNTPESDLGAYGGGSFITDSMMANAYSDWDLNQLEKWFDDRGAVDPRDVAEVIITSYWRHLNGKTLDIEKQVKARVDFWMSTKKDYKGGRKLPSQKIKSEPAKTEATSDK